MITHLQRKPIIRRHVFEEILKADKTTWGKELKILKQLTDGGRYGDFSFWMDMGLGFQLNSLAWFKTPEGAATLEKLWRFHLMDDAQKEVYLQKQREELENELDNVLNGYNYDLMVEPALSKPKRKLSPIEWADLRAE